MVYNKNTSGQRKATGGRPREPKGRNLCDSSGDSKVWMKEVVF